LAWLLATLLLLAWLLAGLAALLLLAGLGLLAGLIALLLLAWVLVGILVLVLTHPVFLQRCWLSVARRLTSKLSCQQNNVR
jgi:hypothetical protein